MTSGLNSSLISIAALLNFTDNDLSSITRHISFANDSLSSTGTNSPRLPPFVRNLGPPGGQSHDTVGTPAPNTSSKVLGIPSNLEGKTNTADLYTVSARSFTIPGNSIQPSKSN